MALLVILSGCANDPTINKFSDPTLVRIADLKDKRSADSLFVYFGHENSAYRRESVVAFGSLQDTSGVGRIGKLLLSDNDVAVRKAAAFALGQIPDTRCERILLEAMAQETVRENIFELLEAYGKTTSQWKLDIKEFISDSVKSAGIAWSLYRAAQRGKTDSLANGVAKRLLQQNFSQQTRLGAAHYFARGASDFADVEQPLIAAASGDPSVEVRMAAALAMAKINSNASLEALKNIIKNERDVRVIANAIRALRGFPYNAVKNYLYDALNHKDVNVGIAASEIILAIVPENNWIEISNLTNLIRNWRIRANVYEAALKAGQHKDLALEVQSSYAKTTDPFQRAALLGSLKHFPEAFTFVEAELREADTAIIRSSAASTLVAMNYSKNFSPAYRARFAKVFAGLMQTEKDPAVLGSLASALGDSSLGYRDVIRDHAFLYAAKNKLHLPEHIEALQPIEAAIAYFEQKKNPVTVKNEFNHPIDWTLVKKVPQDQHVTLKTTRGNIRMRLLVNEAPGSVANFIHLALNDYFDDKFFHRVVPNFVVQAGCKRGDGWGSEKYSIRSEFSDRRYQTGSVGMASAGKDTEGTQWFITHSPTPHLDGRYTIFAEVIEGVKVVDYIQVGDKITDVVIENFKAQ